MQDTCFLLELIAGGGKFSVLGPQMAAMLVVVQALHRAPLLIGCLHVHSHALHSANAKCDGALKREVSKACSDLPWGHLPIVPLRGK